MAKRVTVLLVLFIVALAAFFRFWQLDRIPPGVYPDEAVNGVDSLEALSRGRPQVFYPNNNGNEGLFANLMGLSLKTFGVNQFGLRFPAAASGLLTVLGMFFLTHELFRRRPEEPQAAGGVVIAGDRKAEWLALLAAFFLATSYWHVNFSRIAFRAIPVPVVLAWSFYFLLRAFRRNSYADFLWGGVIFGAGFHTYIAFRVAPLMLAALFFLKRAILSSARVRRGIALCLAAAFVVALPIGIYFLRHPEDFLKRSGAKIGIFEQAHPLAALAKSVGQTALMFNFRGDCNWRHNFSCRPELSPFVSPFFLLGIFLALVELKRKKLGAGKELFILSWFGVFLLPEVLTAEGIPHALRAIGVIMPAYLFAAIGFHAAYTWLEARLPDARKWIAVALAIAILGGTAAMTWRDYFIVWARNPATAGEFTEPYVHIAAYLQTLPAAMPKYVIVNQGDVKVGDVTVHAQTVKLLLIPRPDVAATMVYVDPGNLEKIPVRPAPGSVMIPLKPDEALAGRLRERGIAFDEARMGDFVVWTAR